MIANQAIVINNSHSPERDGCVRGLRGGLACRPGAFGGGVRGDVARWHGPVRLPALRHSRPFWEGYYGELTASLLTAFFGVKGRTVYSRAHTRVYAFVT